MAHIATQPNIKFPMSSEERTYPGFDVLITQSTRTEPTMRTVQWRAEEAEDEERGKWTWKTH